MTVREQIIEVVNRLFIYTDAQQWKKMQEQVFTEMVFLDMSSLGGAAANLSAQEICDGWKEGFEALDAINHLAGNYLVRVDGNEADVFAYATATHFKESATKGKTREFVGTYNMHLIDTNSGWRINHLRYNVKYVNGNMDLE